MYISFIYTYVTGYKSLFNKIFYFNFYVIFNRGLTNCFRAKKTEANQKVKVVIQTEYEKLGPMS